MLFSWLVCLLAFLWLFLLLLLLLFCFAFNHRVRGSS